MDVCQLVEKELEKVLSKFSALREHTQRALGDITTSVDNIRKEISEGETERVTWGALGDLIWNDPNGYEVGKVPEDRELTATQSLVLSQCLRRVRDTVSRLSTEHKDLHSTVSRVGKAIDRNFKSDFSSITTAGAFEGDEKQKILNKVVCEHFLRQGMLDIAEALNEEADLNLEESRKEPFLELHRILEALKEKNLEPALKWAEANRAKLMAQNSSLEFKLHRLQFISLIRQGQSKQHVALLYSKKFAPFASQHAKDLQVLMGSLLYLHQDIEKSPYAYLLDPIYWAEICDVFTRDACTLMGLSVESPLTVSMRAGCIALPPLLSIRQVMQQRHCTSVWTAKDELPVEIDLGSDYHYHSIFACPILRQQSSDNNPPMRLICGHVISQDALNKLTNGTKVKCPYCPIEQIPADAKRIYF